MAKAFWIYIALIFFLILTVASRRGGKSRGGSHRNPSRTDTGSDSSPSHTGNTGSDWDPGRTGNTGSDWDPGRTGYTGSDWDPVRTGNTGSDWDPSHTGNTGSDWDPGRTGNTGSDWDPGRTGNTGSDWDPGRTGNTGSDWDPGRTGNTGSDWDPGRIDKTKTNMEMVAGADVSEPITGFHLGNPAGNMRYRFDNDMDYYYYKRYSQKMPNRVYRPSYVGNRYVAKDRFVTDCYNRTMTEYVMKPSDGKNVSDVDPTEYRVKSTVIRQLCVSEYENGPEYYNGSELNLLFSPKLILFITLFVYFVVE
ncbi:major prion protein-like isoform X2 [Bufo gargarizans]|nr:major prion protein-like isoform X2 [Bufo gargarizans]XP_044135192.1 major prion protein-like isoform X2 [Bufo gargarizans]XP_044135193.1 major prion protein-like isoform X2 [Bufo gargarizans]